MWLRLVRPFRWLSFRSSWVVAALHMKTQHFNKPHLFQIFLKSTTNQVLPDRCLYSMFALCVFLCISSWKFCNRWCFAVSSEPTFLLFLGVFLGFRWKCIYRSRKMEHKTTKRFKQHRRIFDMIFTASRVVLTCFPLMVFLAVDVLFHPRKKKTIEFSVPRRRSITFWFPAPHFKFFR